MSKPKPKIYALLVGINAYESCPLEGCVKDAEAIRDYLTSDLVKAYYSPDIVFLKDEQATRKQIIKQFKAHLGKAEAGSTAFFYFSGHGAQETADKGLWKSETDGKLEGLVCYDSLKKDLLLADKELRYLIHEIAQQQPHIVTLFDCCHSGDNTRGGLSTKGMTARFMPYPKMGYIFPERSWTDFCFYQKIHPQDLVNKPINEVLPQGTHLQLSACQSDQLAYETKIVGQATRRGIFTYTLLDILQRSNGIITYFDLKSRLLNYIKNQFPQTPTIYGSDAKNQVIYQNFLGGEQGSQPLYGNVIFNASRNSWILDLGAIHGISPQANTVRIIQNGTSRSATIRQVNSSDTELEVTDLEPAMGYKGYVFPFKSAPIGVYLSGEKSDQLAIHHLHKYIQDKGGNINLVTDEAVADYVVRMTEHFCYITLPNDPNRPLVLPVDRLGEIDHSLIYSQLYHISQWAFVKSLHNYDTASILPANAVAVEFFEKDGQTLIPIEQDCVRPELFANDANNYCMVKLTNRSPQDLYVALLYLGIHFEIFDSLLERGVQLLGPQESIWLTWDRTNQIPYGMEDSKRLFNWFVSQSYFKLIASTQTFSVHNLCLTDLPDPIELLKSATRSGASKGLIKKRSTSMEKWTTRLLTFEVKNADFNQVNLAALRANLATKAGVFLRGLYLEDGAEMVLKEGIE